MVCQRNKKRQTLNERRTQFPIFTELKERFDVKTIFPVYHGLVSCIKLLRKAIQNHNETNRNFSTFVENFIKAPKSNGLAYKKLVSAKQSSPRRSQEKWRADCSAPRQSIGILLKNYLFTALKLPNLLFFNLNFFTGV